MRLHLAGVERRSALFNEAKPPYILGSFAYVTEKVKEPMVQCVKSSWVKAFLLDSGAFTFQTKPRTNAEMDAFVDAYAEFINDCDFNLFFEMDIDNIVGLQKVEEYRRRIEHRTCRQSIPVWHANRGWEYFKRMCREYTYVSIGGIVNNPHGRALEKTFPYFIDYARNHGVQIHGLGYTETRKLRKYPFDSVDSTSWSAGGRYARYFELGPDGLMSRKMEHPEGKGVDCVPLDRHNLEVWTRYSKMIDR